MAEIGRFCPLPSRAETKLQTFTAHFTLPSSGRSFSLLRCLSVWLLPPPESLATGNAPNLGTRHMLEQPGRQGGSFFATAVRHCGITAAPLAVDQRTRKP